MTATGQVGICPYVSLVFGPIAELDRILAGGAYHDLVASRFNTAIAGCAGCPIEGICDGSCYVSSDCGNRTGRRCDFYRAMTRRLIAWRVARVVDGGGDR